ncbi:MAG: hypothetical protein AB4080_16530 [Trichodesmium sp.]
MTYSRRCPYGTTRDSSAWAALAAVLNKFHNFQIDEPHRQNPNPVGKLHSTSLLWSTEMKTAVI